MRILYIFRLSYVRQASICTKVYLNGLDHMTKIVETLRPSMKQEYKCFIEN